MKELNIEQKAKAYDEAIKKAEVLYKTAEPMSGCNVLLETVFPELAESEDERIRKTLINGFNKLDKSAVWYNGITNAQVLAWLERQGEHANFRNKIEVGDKVTRNRDGYLVNLSQLNRVAKPADKVEPKFNERDWVIIDGETLHITNVTEDGYSTEEGGYIPFRCEKDARLWTIQDAKDGDILFLDLMCGKTFIYNGVNPNMEILYSFIINNDGEDVLPYPIGRPNTGIGNIEENKNIVHPATKEQRDALKKAMTDAGYIWDAEKKKLKKIEHKPTDVRTTGYWHVEDVEQKPTDEEMKTLLQTEYEKGRADAISEIQEYWSEEDEDRLNSCVNAINAVYKWDSMIAWLKSLKDRVQPQQEKEWKQENIDDLTDFENVMMHIGDSFFGENAGLDPNDTTAIKEQANILSGLVPSKEWSEEDRIRIANCIQLIGKTGDGEVEWLKSLESRILPQTKQEWSEEDETRLTNAVIMLKEGASLHFNKKDITKAVDWLKSLSPQNRWKPSAFHLECIEDAISLYEKHGINAIGLKEILEELKKLREE